MSHIVKAFVSAIGLFVLAGAAHAEGPPSPAEFSFAVGQIVGSNLACGATKESVTPVAEKAFAKLKVDVTEGNDNYKRFVAGIQDGIKQVKDGAAKCEDVKAGFVQFSEKLN